MGIMSKIKHFVLGIVGVVLITAGLFSCNNKEQGKFDRKAVATINGDVATPLYDEDAVKNALVSEGLFAEVKSVELVYGFNSDENKNYALLTIIGKNTSDLLQAFEAKLMVNNDKLIMVSPAIDSDLFTIHTCNNVNCNNCDFATDQWQRITGCKSCATDDIIEQDQTAFCNHSMSTGNSGVILRISNVVARHI